MRTVPREEAQARLLEILKGQQYLRQVDGVDCMVHPPQFSHSCGGPPPGAGAPAIAASEGRPLAWSAGGYKGVLRGCVPEVLAAKMPFEFPIPFLSPAGSEAVGNTGVGLTKWSTTKPGGVDRHLQRAVL